MWKRWSDLTLWKRIVLAFVAAISLGALMKRTGVYDAHAADTLSAVPDFLFEIVLALGPLFINAIKMLMVPIIFITIVNGVTSLHDGAKLGRLSAKTIGLYLVTTAFAVTLGLVMANVIRPGEGIDLPADIAGDTAAAGAMTIRDLLIGLVPANPVKAMTDGNVLQIIVFALLIGISINLAGDAGKTVRHFFDSATEVMFKLVHLIMETAPYGIFALIIWVIGELSVAELFRLGWIVVTLYLACLVQIGLVYGGLLALFARLSPIHFFRGIVDAQAVAFSTSTSAGTLPVTLANVEDNLGVSKKIASFVLPLGATMNMDGTAIYMGIAAVFTAQALGIDLSFMQYATIVLTGVLASIGAASIPSAGLIIMPVVLSSVGLPLGAIALFFPIDRIMDMMRTLTNVTGDAMVSVLVAKSEGELDMTTFRAPAIE